MKQLIFTLSLFFTVQLHAQYIAVKARYTETRLVANAPYPPSRENRLVLSFYSVDDALNLTPIRLINYTIYMLKEGLQYGVWGGNVQDSAGNNYPGYTMTAPMAVAYYNGLNGNYIECDPNAATAYTFTGKELDCGFVRVSHWDAAGEKFSAPNVCLPYYPAPHAYAHNFNFGWPVPATAPYNYYSFDCGGAERYLIVRGVLRSDSTQPLLLPVKLANEKAIILNTGQVKVSWSNLTEQGVLHYVVERSADRINFSIVTTVQPSLNNGGAVNYEILDGPVSTKCYYRIKAVNTDGSFVYSKVLVVNPRADARLIILPNPSADARFAVTTEIVPAGNYIVSLTDASGHVTIVSRIDHRGGRIQRVYDLHRQPPGVYTLELRSAQLQLSQKVMILQ